MNKKIFGKLIFIFISIIQLIISCLSFFIFTSTNKMFPWYEPLTFGAFIVLCFLTPVQIIITAIFISMYEKMQIPKMSYIVSVSNLIIIISILIITILKESLFYPFALLYAGVEVVLISVILFLFIKWVIYKTNSFTYKV